jgi:hypothetical protein
MPASSPTNTDGMKILSGFLADIGTEYTKKRYNSKLVH